ncbi:AAA family ATPase [Serratia microhaemolytica]|uniref:AAA family ATPase n=1 Tax=Serratia microhaemolytica TaxID=2675110 RepID=UPI000FDE50D4|nr:AAA family ATPase [Serratia microhaemolytica]
MRILQLRFSNLNSLCGEWQIDFTHPAFIADGIFAIIGPTGAGKSTILDALCLALYGRTPRLHKVSKSSNEIISRQRGECFAEVTFETQSGSYRCHWSQRRARNKANGELQPPKHEISDAESGQLLENKINEVAKRIEVVTGMDFDRFTRSMLLAQGGFAAFLQASADERAPILERITGSEIYSQISQRAHKLRQQEQQTLSLLQAATAGIELLSAEQEQQMMQHIIQQQQQREQLSQQLASIGQAIDWWREIERRQAEIAGLAEQRQQLQHEQLAFQPQRSRLQRALAAAELDGLYSRLTTLRQQQQQDQQQLRQQQQALPALQTQLEQQTAQYLLAQRQLAQQRSAFTDAEPLLQQVRLLDQSLADQQHTINQHQQLYQQAQSQLATEQAVEQQQQQQKQATEQQLANINHYLLQHQADRWLESGLASVELQLNSLLTLQHHIEQTEQREREQRKLQQQSATTLAQQQQQVTACQQQLQQSELQLQQRQAALQQLLAGRLLREYRSEKEALLREIALLRQIAALEQQRATLTDGKPCPLCGATEHPFAQGNLPQPDETEQQITRLTCLIEQAELQQQQLEQWQLAEKQAREQLIRAESELQRATQQQQHLAQRQSDITQQLTTQQADFAAQWQAVLSDLQPLGVTEFAPSQITTLLATLTARLRAWQQKISERTVIEQKLAAINGELTQLSPLIDNRKHALAQQQQRLTLLQQQLTDSQQQRQQLFGDDDPETRQQQLKRAISDAEHSVELARHAEQESQRQCRDVQQAIASLTLRINECQQQLQQTETDFVLALPAQGFSHEAELLAAILSPAERQQLAEQANALDQRDVGLSAQQAQSQQALAQQRALQISQQPLAELLWQQSSLQPELERVLTEITKLQLQLDNNQQQRQKSAEAQAAIVAQQRECQRWEDLYQLIGSHDGKKYRNFAQGLTFEIMVNYANQQLQKMSDRYLLIRDRNQPLELNVIDNYQAGEIRSTKNLSGGESFIVSLALALGLAQMASQNVRVDSLFLDEGFGTLDEEALNTALEALASLQQTGKLIGVISHVAALKERISTQILVTPQIGGRSELSGPGCSSAN